MITFKNPQLKQYAQNDFSLRPADGIYILEDGRYFVNFCHGVEDGEISLQIHDEHFDVTPADIRACILGEMGFRIKREEKIVINPCHPKAVIEKYAEEFEKANIEVLGSDIEGIQSYAVFDGERLLPDIPDNGDYWIYSGEHREIRDYFFCVLLEKAVERLKDKFYK